MRCMALSQDTLSPKMQAIFERLTHQIDHPDEDAGNRYVDSLCRRIQASENHFGMTSEVMIARLDAGEIEETSGICDWLMDIKALDHAEAAR